MIRIGVMPTVTGRVFGGLWATYITAPTATSDVIIIIIVIIVILVIVIFIIIIMILLFLSLWSVLAANFLRSNRGILHQ